MPTQTCSPQGLHELVHKIAVSEKKIVLQSLKMVQKTIFLKEHVKETLTGNLVSGVDGSFQPNNVTVLQS